MLVAALVIGALTAFYFGVRNGAYAAGAALAALVAAQIAPGIAVWAYAALGAGVVGVCTIGPRRASPTHAAKATRIARQGLAALKARLRWK